MARAKQDILESLAAQIGAVVLQREQRANVRGQRSLREGCTARVGRVQQCCNPTVALVEVSLPIQTVVFFGPRHVPHGSAGQRDRRESVLCCTQTVFGVVPLDKEGQGQTDLSNNGLGDQAHPPTVVGNIDAAVQARIIADGALSQVNRCEFGVDSSPPELVSIDSLTHRVQDRTLIRIEHVAADNRRGQRVLCEGEGAEQTFRLDDGVIVEQQDVVRIGVLEHLVHATRETSGTAQVRLFDDTELASEFFLQTRVTLTVLHVLIALIDNENLGDVFKDIGFCLEALRLRQAVFRKVVGGDTHGHIGVTVTFARRH